MILYNGGWVTALNWDRYRVSFVAAVVLIWAHSAAYSQSFGGRMTERSDHNLEALITSKMRELIACMCVVEFKQEGDRRGVIERIESLTLGKDFPESFERSQFRVHLTSGDIVVVPGSAISAIESTTAASHASKTRKTRKKPGMKARKGRTNNMLAEKRKSIAMKTSKAAARTRTRKAKERKRVRENEG